MKKQFSSLLIYLLLIFSIGSLFSQNTQIGYLDFEGKIMANNKGLVGALIEVYEGSSKVKSVTTKMFGNFNVRLKFNKKYTLKISKNEMVSKSVEVNTSVKDDSYVYAFEFEVGLFNYVDGLGTKEITEPVTKISFDQKQKEFDFDKAYTQKIKAKVDAIYAKQQKLKKQEYTKLIAAADKELQAKNYEKAIELYDKAIDADPFAEYPDKQIIICEGLIMEKQKNEKDGDKNAKYAATIKLANAQFDIGKYNKAISLYEKALNYNSFSDFADKRIDECEKRIDDLADLDKNYKKAISSGNKYFSQKKYETSKTNFESALALKPNEQYPKDKLSEISKLMGELADKNGKDKIEADYQKLIALADASLKSKKYNDAKSNYNKALGIKAAEQYPKDKIKEIDGILLANADNVKKEQKYKSLIANADKLFNSSNLEDSKAKYTGALALKPNEKYPTDRIKEINEKLSELASAKQTQDKYNALIKSGDEKLAAKKYETAKVDYQNALNIKKKEVHPKRMIAVCDKALASLASEEENTKKYTALVEKGKTQFANSNWEDAKISFTSAKNIKPDEQYPKIKLKEIEVKLLAEADKKKLNENYKKTIAEADANLKSKNYSEAKTDYEKASSLKPTEQYPKDKLKEVEGLLTAAAGKAQKEKEYLALIDSGDKLFVNKKYEESKNKYTSALALKTSEKHPQNRIKEIDGILAEIAAKNKQEQNYQNLIKAGDTKLANKDYENARIQFTDALKLKPEQTYPKNKLAEIDKAMAALASQKENDAKYAELIKKADASFGSSKWQDAKLSYTSAKNIKPTEQYPKDKLKEVETKLLAEANQKQINENYKTAIAEADAQLKSKNYSGAKTNYTKANGLKPTEQYPKDKLKEVEGLLLTVAQNAKKEEQYKSLIAEADKLFSANKLEESKTKYNGALAIKSAEQYPKDKLAEIESRIAKIANANANEKKYNDLIASGDNMFDRKDYENARTKYSDASTIKPGETYPKNRIIEIDNKLQVLLEQKRKDKEYNSLISTADSKFAANKFKEAKLDYLAALQMKQNEKYPKGRIEEIDKKIAQLANQKSINAKYDKAISTADVYYKAKKYGDALKNYNKAIELKPTEQYPKDKASKAESLLKEAEQKALADKQYKDQMKKGEVLLSAKKYDQARAEFVKASEMKPDKKQPKDKIANIDASLAVLAANKKKNEERDTKYKNLISSADRLLKSKKYKEAKGTYSKASLLKSKEQYPKDKIAEIQAILNKQKAVADKKTEKKKAEEKPKEIKPKPKLASLKFANAAEKRKYLSSLAKQYPDRKTVENYTEDNGKQIKRIIINNGGIAHEYRKVKQPWGAMYFFKDGKSISKSLFYGETK